MVFPGYLSNVAGFVMTYRHLPKTKRRRTDEYIHTSTERVLIFDEKSVFCLHPADTHIYPFKLFAFGAWQKSFYMMVR